MLSYIFCATGLALTALAAPAAYLQDCSFTSGEPCKCPEGTVFRTSTTWATIGASAKDVKKITGSYFTTAWFGTNPDYTTGADNKKGAVRALTAGNLTFLEELVEDVKEKHDGSFTHRFQQKDVPLTQNTSAGLDSYAGYWDVYEVKSAGPCKTQIRWHIHACFTNPSTFGEFHESAINNVTSILQSQYKICGPNVPPYSV